MPSQIQTLRLSGSCQWSQSQTLALYSKLNHQPSKEITSDSAITHHSPSPWVQVKFRLSIAIPSNSIYHYHHHQTDITTITKQLRTTYYVPRISTHCLSPEVRSMPATCSTMSFKALGVAGCGSQANTIQCWRWIPQAKNEKSLRFAGLSIKFVWVSESRVESVSCNWFAVWFAFYILNQKSQSWNKIAV